MTTPAPVQTLRDTPISNLRNALQILHGMRDPNRITSLDADIDAVCELVQFSIAPEGRPMIESVVNEHVTKYSHGRSRDSDYSPSAFVITSVEVRASGRHDRVSIWNRGGLTGEIVVDAGDGVTIAKRLLESEVR